MTKLNGKVSKLTAEMGKFTSVRSDIGTLGTHVSSLIQMTERLGGLRPDLAKLAARVNSLPTLNELQDLRQPCLPGTAAATPPAPQAAAKPAPAPPVPVARRPDPIRVTPPQGSAAPAAKAPFAGLDRGWIYVGQFTDGRWLERWVDIGDTTDPATLVDSEHALLGPVHARDRTPRLGRRTGTLGPATPLTVLAIDGPRGGGYVWGKISAEGKEHWAYLGQYNVGSAQWVERSINIPEDRRPEDLDGTQPTVRSQLNTRDDVPRLGTRIGLLPAGTNVKVLDIQGPRAGGFVWARVLYRAEEDTLGKK
jgi:hypothetical protein